VLVHPALERLPTAQLDWGIDACLAAPVSSSLGVLRLILSGMLDRVPALTPVVPHLGGVLPFLAQRVDDQAAGVNRHSPGHYLRTRLLYDTCSFRPPALRATVETTGATRLLLGSDFPFRGPLDRAVGDVNAHLAAADRAAVLGGNAIRAFSRLAPLGVAGQPG
jgi:aminocarboxymuconate-semialdehyde decarboxylase